jgi:predicted outer membrane repeat protein
MAKNDGGSIYLYSNSVYSNSPSCVFIKNSANYGGSICIELNSVY